RGLPKNLLATRSPIPIMSQYPLSRCCHLAKNRSRAGHFGPFPSLPRREAMAQADDWSWERYRPLLKLQYRQFQLDPRFQRRFDASDLVQDALLRALQKLDQFRGQSEGERFKWLQKIFRNRAIDRIREETAEQDDVHRDQSMDDAFAESS